MKTLGPAKGFDWSHSQAEDSPTQSSPVEPHRGPAGRAIQGSGTGDRCSWQEGPVGTQGLLGACGPPPRKQPPTFESPRAGPVPTGVTPCTPSKGNEHGRGCLLYPLCRFPTCQPAARTRPHWGHTGFGCTHHIWAHQSHSGSCPKPTYPRARPLTTHALHKPVLGAQGAWGQLGPSPSPGPTSSHHGREEARPRDAGGTGGCWRKRGRPRSLQFLHPRAPVPSPGSSVLTQSALPAPCITSSDPCILVMEVPEQEGPRQPGGRVRGLQRGCRPEGLYGHGAWPWAARRTGGPGGSESPG